MSFRTEIALGLLLSCAGCQGGYPIAATHCDEWCDASQDGACGNYDPAGCVAGCESQGLDNALCVQDFEALLSCLKMPSNKPMCAYVTSQSSPPCNSETASLFSCASEHMPRGSQPAP